AHRSLTRHPHPAHVVLKIEVGVALPARRRRAERVERDALAQAGHLLERAQHGPREALRVGRPIEHHHADDGRAQQRGALDVGEEGVALTQAVFVADRLGHGVVLRTPPGSRLARSAVVGSAPSVSEEDRAPTAAADPTRFLESALRAIVFGAGAYAQTLFDFLFR